MSERRPPKRSTSKTTRRDPMIGKVIARVRLEEYLGGGATAVVYRGVHEGMGTDVGVKILRPKAAAVPSVREAFRREGRAIARIDSENVLKVYDVVREGTLHAMVMEMVEGEQVLDLVTRRGLLAQIDALRILRQAAAGLAAVHAKGIVHRDVKPQNLVVMPDGTVKLVDFGLAFEGGDARTRVGTPHYLAPETCADGHSEPASDVYSLGITFFHLLVGQPPYAGRAVADVLRAHLNGEPVDLDERRPGLAPPVRELFERMTKNDRILRPTAAELVEAVDRVGGKKLRRRSPLRFRERRARVARAAAIAAAVLVLAGAGLFLVHVRKENPVPVAKAEAPEPAPVAPVVPPPPRRTDEELARATAKREAILAKDRALEEEADRLLRSVESWARRHWKTRADTRDVVRRYRQIGGPLRKTKSYEEAGRRIAAIEAGLLHPHPDRAWTPPEEVEAVREAWESGRSVVEAHVAAGRYREAKAALPSVVSDPEGELERELRFQHELLDELVAFPSTLAARLEASTATSRALDTKAGRGEVLSIEDAGLTLVIEGASKNVPWSDVEPRAVARFALPLFDAVPFSEMRRFFAFCAGHGLRDVFFQARMFVDTVRLDPVDAAFLRALESHLPK